MTGEVMSDRLAATLIADRHDQDGVRGGRGLRQPRGRLRVARPPPDHSRRVGDVPAGRGAVGPRSASNAVLIQHPDLNRVSIIGATLTNGGFPAYANMAMTARRAASARQTLPTISRPPGPLPDRVALHRRRDVAGHRHARDASGCTHHGRSVGGERLEPDRRHADLNRIVIANFASMACSPPTASPSFRAGSGASATSGRGVYVGASSTINYTTGSIYALAMAERLHRERRSTITTDATGVSLVGSGNATYGGAALYNSALLSGAVDPSPRMGRTGRCAVPRKRARGLCVLRQTTVDMASTLARRVL